MKILNAQLVTHLSFPDFDVEGIEFLPKEKKLKIFVEGAWLDISGGQLLGRGVLIFEKWNSLTISAFDQKGFTLLASDKIEDLKDICEAKFSPNEVTLAGFSKSYGWIVCKIVHAEMQAEFS